MNTLDMIMWAPILQMMFAYWFLSNKQVFANVVFNLRTVKDVTLCGHHVLMDLTSMKMFDPSMPCLLVFVALIMAVPFGKMSWAIIQMIKPNFMQVKINVDENLGNYFTSIEKEDSNWMALEEENVRRNYVSIPMS